MTPPSPVPCLDGGSAAQSLSTSEVEAIARTAARALADLTLTVAIVDRAGRPLTVFRKPSADPDADDRALAVARTAAFFSNNQAPLSSRTVRFISGVHFPPGVTNARSGPLYGIESSNRGCDLNVQFNEGKCLPRPRRLGASICASGVTSGCGEGILTGKQLPDDAQPGSVEAGGVPLYRVILSGGRVTAGTVVGAIGVVGRQLDPSHVEYAAAQGAFAAIGTGIAPVPFFPIPFPGAVYLEGVRLPFLGPSLRLVLEGGLPVGVHLNDVAGGQADGTFVFGPESGGCAANGDLAGPHAGALLTEAEVLGVVTRAVATAKRTRAQIRLPLDRYARLVIAVTDIDGSILALHRMPDATVFSVDVAVAKARNVVYFTGTGIDGRTPAGTAVTNRTIGAGAQPFYPSGIDSSAFDPRRGPWFDTLFLHDLAHPCSQGPQAADPNQNGVVFFAGSTPLYRDGRLVGGLGVSGDGLEQDDYVAWHAAGELRPPPAMHADRVVVDGVRLPMFRFPRQPEGVTECEGGPCD